jgi:lysylphosphatidylglycerol synthetase-like protein (DUF2156 family)
LAQPPQDRRLRPLELFFAFLGMTTLSGLLLVWFKVVPDLLRQTGIDAPGGWAGLVLHPAFQGVIVLACIGLLAAGLATRISTGSARATLILGGGCLLAFVALWASVRVLYEPVIGPALAEASADARDDAGDGT